MNVQTKLPIPVLNIDVFAPAFFDDPYPVHAVMRDAGPAVFLDQYGIYAVARHAEVRAVLTDWAAFSSASGVGLADFRKEPPWRLPSLVLETDPPFHDRTRAVLSRVLSASALKTLRERFAIEADLLIDRLLSVGSFDAIPDLAEAYPLTVFPDAIGMSPDNRHYLLPYGNMVFNSFGPRNALFENSVRDAAEVVTWVLAQSQRANLAPIGFGADIYAAADRGELTAEEAPQVVRSLLTAGVDTTVSALSAALDALAHNPDQFGLLRANPALARNAFEEAVRLETPVQTFFRTTTREVSVGGATIPAGKKVLVFMGSANRDPRKWDRPDTYDITRNPTVHVGYGAGVHVCVGMLLARMEGQSVLSALARKVTAIVPAGAPVRRHNNTLRSLASLPVRLVA